MSAAIGLYRALSRAAVWPVDLHLRRRAARGKEDPARLGERWGEASVLRPTGPLVWLHAASVGESVSVLPLVARLLDDPALSVLVTSNTVTSAQLMADRLPPRALHQYAPVDLPGAVERFVDHWRPGLALFVESELWPNLISALRARAVPMAIVQGRLSARSWRRWRRYPAAARQLLGGFRMVIAQTAEDAARYSRLGAPVVRPLGTLKYAAEPLPADAAALAGHAGQGAEQLLRIRHARTVLPPQADSGPPGGTRRIGRARQMLVALQLERCEMRRRGSHQARKVVEQHGGLVLENVP